MSAAVSPDVSPISTTSALLTPPDQSPAEGFGEWKFAPYDFASAYQNHVPNTLLFETDPHSIREYATPQHPLYSSIPTTDTMPLQGRAFPPFEPFHERPNVVNGNPVRDTGLTDRARQESAYMQPGAWTQPRLRSSSVEWVKPEERRASESSAGHMEPTYSPSRSHGGGSAHEVSECFSQSLYGTYSDCFCKAYQLPVIASSCVVSSL